jgi:malate dehydrogenase (oxaloacetate-decarboxylating)
MADNAEALAKVCSTVAKAGAHLGAVTLISLESQHQVRDLTLYLADRKQLTKILTAVPRIEGVEVVQVRDEILEIHRRGSIEMRSRVAIRNQTDMRMLYTPGVAQVCEAIQADPKSAWEWTGLCDRIAIVTNGTAILGLGDIGPLAGLPVMEGKAALLAAFVQVSGVPILLETKNVDEFVAAVVAIAPSFGAIQLEDVAAPSCFEIEQRLKDRLDIPVFHDDQHGTATVVLASLINALRKTGRKPESSSAVMLGAGAAGIAVTRMLMDYGLGDIVLYDTQGPLYRGRTANMNPYKEEIARLTNKNNQKCPLAEGFKGKDLFIGLSKPNMVTQAMVRSMAKNPIVMPLGNPVGEITTDEALAAGAAIALDGRDVNNALAYPALFRGALDVRATDITMEMKVAAARKIASLAPEGHLLPDPLDRDIHGQIAAAVAAAWK